MKPFYEAASEERLIVQRCAECGATRFPAVQTCSSCLASDMRWIETKGIGEVFSFVIMHQIYHPWFADKTPYVVAQIKLDEGPRILSTVIDVEPDEVRIGMAVEVAFQKCSDEISLPVFRVRG
jgi:hypothetical protein